MRRRTLRSLLLIALAATPASAQLPPADTPPPVATARAELVRFNTAQVELRWVDGRHLLAAGDVVLKDFGKREVDGREALRLVRELRLTERGTVGKPLPVLEYWLADGQAPAGPVAGLRTLTIDQQTLRAEEMQGQWVVRDAVRVFFTFGSRADDAREALGVLQRYNFSQVGFLGQAQMSMLLFLGGNSATAPRATGPTPLKTPATPQPASLGQKPRTLVDAMKRPAPTMPSTPPSPGRVTTPGRLPFGQSPERSGVIPASVTGEEANALQQAFLQQGRPLTPGAMPSAAGAIADRIPIDIRQVRIAREGQEYRLVVGDVLLASFGTNEGEARQAQRVLDFYRFTEYCVIGHPQPAFSYFLVNGQIPRGLMLGMGGTPFQAEALSLRQLDNAWIIDNGGQVLLNFGDRAEEALKVLQALKTHKPDHLVRLAPGEGSPTLLLRTR